MKEHKVSQQSEQEEILSPGKRLFWRIFSMILFIIIIWAVVTLTDLGLDWIKGFFASK